MICEDVRAAMGAGEICEETDAGARVVTHCLYPSFEPVAVFVTKVGEGYRVSDGGRAARNAWTHGQEDHFVKRILGREASRYSLKVSGAALVADIPNIDWLRAAILATANASAAAAHAALAKVSAAAEVALKDKIRDALEHVISPKLITPDVVVRGSSGDERRFDYGVRAENDTLLLISAVAPHHSSVAAKYVAFADTKDADEHVTRYAVYDRPLERGDISLMMQVVDLVPLKALDPKARQALAR